MARISTIKSRHKTRKGSAIFRAFRESLQEISKIQKETAQQMKETDRRMEETDRRMKETDRQMEETARQMKESGQRVDKALGKLGNRFGELVEHLVAPNISEKFNALGYHFEGVFQNCKIKGPDGTSTEIDLLLTNGEFSVAIEVKAKPNDEDVKDHIRRMDILRRHMDKQHDTRKLRGAIAGGIMSETTRNYALKTGFYVIEQSGDTVSLNIPPGFIPREW
jgi:hypothetical protein